MIFFQWFPTNTSDHVLFVYDAAEPDRGPALQFPNYKYHTDNLQLYIRALKVEWAKRI